LEDVSYAVMQLLLADVKALAATTNQSGLMYI